MKQEANTPRTAGPRAVNSSKNPPSPPPPSPSANIFKTPVYGQDQAPAPGSVVGANNRLVVGYIGTGKQGMAHVRHPKSGRRRQ